jgi:hypothetical protein
MIIVWFDRPEQQCEAVPPALLRNEMRLKLKNQAELVFLCDLNRYRCSTESEERQVRRLWRVIPGVAPLLGLLKSYRGVKNPDGSSNPLRNESDLTDQIFANRI